MFFLSTAFVGGISFFVMMILRYALDLPNAPDAVYYGLLFFFIDSTLLFVITFAFIKPKKPRETYGGIGARPVLAILTVIAAYAAFFIIAGA